MRTLTPLNQRFDALIDRLRTAWSSVREGSGDGTRRRLRIPELTSLKARLTLASSLMALVILLLIHFTLSRTAAQIASSQARHRADEVLSYLSAAVAESVAANDLLQVHVLARAFEKSGVTAIVITDGEGDELYATSSDLPQARSGSSGEGEGDGALADLLHSEKSVHFSDTLVGEIRVWIDPSTIEARIHEANAPIYWIVRLGFVLFVALGFVNLYSPFRALRRLGAAAERIGAGDLSERVPVKGSDEVAHVCRAFNSMADGLSKARDETLEKHLETIHAMINTVEAKDRYTVGHCLRVGGFSRDILEHFDHLSSEEIFLIETGALLHDIGKIGIPDHILLKEDPLSAQENKIVQSHVIVGENILDHLESMKEVARCVRHHHERWDGLGYPDGLRGQAIPLGSRVIAVADAIDAMKTDRPYRRGFTRERVIDILKEERGKQFDPTVVDFAVAFLESAPDAGDRDNHGHRRALGQRQLQYS